MSSKKVMTPQEIFDTVDSRKIDQFLLGVIGVPKGVDYFESKSPQGNVYNVVSYDASGIMGRVAGVNNFPIKTPNPDVLPGNPFQKWWLRRKYVNYQKYVVKTVKDWVRYREKRGMLDKGEGAYDVDDLPKDARLLWAHANRLLRNYVSYLKEVEALNQLQYGKEEKKPLSEDEKTKRTEHLREMDRNIKLSRGFLAQQIKRLWVRVFKPLTKANMRPMMPSDTQVSSEMTDVESEPSSTSSEDIKKEAVESSTSSQEIKQVLQERGRKYLERGEWGSKARPRAGSISGEEWDWENRPRRESLSLDEQDWKEEESVDSAELADDEISSEVSSAEHRDYEELNESSSEDASTVIPELQRVEGFMLHSAVEMDVTEDPELRKAVLSNLINNLLLGKTARIGTGVEWVTHGSGGLLENFANNLKYKNREIEDLSTEKNVVAVRKAYEEKEANEPKEVLTDLKKLRPAKIERLKEREMKIYTEVNQRIHNWMVSRIKDGKVEAISSVSGLSKSLKKDYEGLKKMLVLLEEYEHCKDRLLNRKELGISARDALKDLRKAQKDLGREIGVSKAKASLSERAKEKVLERGRTITGAMKPGRKRAGAKAEKQLPKPNVIPKEHVDIVMKVPEAARNGDLIVRIHKTTTGFPSVQKSGPRKDKPAYCRFTSDHGSVEVTRTEDGGMNFEILVGGIKEFYSEIPQLIKDFCRKEGWDMSGVEISIPLDNIPDKTTGSNQAYAFMEGFAQKDMHVKDFDFSRFKDKKGVEEIERKNNQNRPTAASYDIK